MSSYLTMRYEHPCVDGLDIKGCNTFTLFIRLSQRYILHGLFLCVNKLV